MINELVTRSFAARDISHLRHWETKSYAAHLALGNFYSDVIGATDAVVENYIGMFGKFKAESFSIKADYATDMAEYLQAEADWLETNLQELSNGSESISNLIQTLISVYTKACFMLSLK